MRVQVSELAVVAGEAEVVQHVVAGQEGVGQAVVGLVEEQTARQAAVVPPSAAGHGAEQTGMGLAVDQTAGQALVVPPSAAEQDAGQTGVGAGATNQTVEQAVVVPPAAAGQVVGKRGMVSAGVARGRYARTGKHGDVAQERKESRLCAAVEKRKRSQRIESDEEEQAKPTVDRERVGTWFPRKGIG